MTDYIEISIAVENEDQKDILVARLADTGFEGFEEDRKLLKAYIPENEFDQLTLQSILEPEGLTYSSSVIAQKNWNEAWESGFDPVIIGRFCAIRASFHAPVEDVEHELVITPKMSFGTGHHATTFMMIETMGSIDFSGKKVLDFGTGTGVLAILAEKLGASEVVAIDNDEWSINNGKENIQMNDCGAISLYQADSLETAGKVHVLLANINKNVIMHHFRSMKEHLLPGGTLLLSGLLAGDFEDIRTLVMEENLVLCGTKHRGNWISMHIVNR